MVGAFEGGAHDAGIDEEGFGLVFVPVVGGSVDREAGFYVGLHGVGAAWVVGEEVNFGLAVFCGD